MLGEPFEQDWVLPDATTRSRILSLGHQLISAPRTAMEAEPVIDEEPDSNVDVAKAAAKAPVVGLVVDGFFFLCSAVYAVFLLFQLYALEFLVSPFLCVLHNETAVKKPNPKAIDRTQDFAMVEIALLVVFLLETWKHARKKGGWIRYLKNPVRAFDFFVLVLCLFVDVWTALKSDATFRFDFLRFTRLVRLVRMMRMYTRLLREIHRRFLRKKPRMTVCDGDAVVDGKIHAYLDRCASEAGLVPREAASRRRGCLDWLGMSEGKRLLDRAEGFTPSERFKPLQRKKLVVGDPKDAAMGTLQSHHARLTSPREQSALGAPLKLLHCVCVCHRHAALHAGRVGVLHAAERGPRDHRARVAGPRRRGESAAGGGRVRVVAGK